jgi:ATP synthase protein I
LTAARGACYEARQSGRDFQPLQPDRHIDSHLLEKAAEPVPAWKPISASAVGIEMAVSILIGWGAGTWLDGRFGTEPILMLAGLLFGVAAAFRALLRGGREAWSFEKPGDES